MLDLKRKTVFKYASKYKGKYIFKMVLFPNFNRDTFPLILIREKGYVVVFNIKLKQYFLVADDIGQYGNSICFLDKINNEFTFITQI